MLERYSVALNSAEHSLRAEWFEYIQVVMSHPDLDPDEKFIWIWLVIQCANTTGNTTSLTYETLSHAVNKPPKTVHRSLLRLRIMGFLNGNIPIWYGEPTTEMMNEMRTLRPIPLSREDYLEQLTIKKELEKKGLIWRTYDKKPILINLNSKAEDAFSTE